MTGRFKPIHFPSNTKCRYRGKYHNVTFSDISLGYLSFKFSKMQDYLNWKFLIWHFSVSCVVKVELCLNCLPAKSSVLRVYLQQFFIVSHDLKTSADFENSRWNNN